MNRWHDKFAAGRRAERRPYWDTLYRDMFGEMYRSFEHIDDKKLQQTLGDHKVLLDEKAIYCQYVDVKARSRRYDDFLVEEKHANGYNTMRWGHPDHPLKATWIAYEFPHKGEGNGYRVVMASLQGIRHARFIFREGLERRQAQNDGYQTHNVHVPWDTFCREVDTRHYWINMDDRFVRRITASNMDI